MWGNNSENKCSDKQEGVNDKAYTLRYIDLDDYWHYWKNQRCLKEPFLYISKHGVSFTVQFPCVSIT